MWLFKVTCSIMPDLEVTILHQSLYFSFLLRCSASSMWRCQYVHFSNGCLWMILHLTSCWTLFWDKSLDRGHGIDGITHLSAGLCYASPCQTLIDYWCLYFSNSTSAQNCLDLYLWKRFFLSAIIPHSSRAVGLPLIGIHVCTHVNAVESGNLLGEMLH